MSVQEFTPGQAVDYCEFSLGGYGWTWEHGHIAAIVDDARFPIIVIDTTIYDYRPSTAAVEPHKVRPATTECTANGMCQEIGTAQRKQPSNLAT